MVSSQEGLGRSEKINDIISAAQIRFGLYGIEKTSMQEISSDLNMSKGSLYYYFPDKEHLYKAVVEKEQSEFISILNEKINQIDDPVLLLEEYVKTRLVYFRSLMNLSRLRLESYSEIRPLISDVLIKFRKNEKEIIMNIFRDGNEKKIFKIEDIDETASLFLDLLRGLRVTMINKMKLLYIGQEEYDMIMKKTISFTNIFIKGLKYR
jgi:AcrR family transcriptional regulator